MNSAFALYTGISWFAVLLYVLATVANSYGLIFRREQAERVGCRFAWAGFLFHGGALVYFWIQAGHGPYLTRSEVLSADAWILLCLFLVFSRVFPVIQTASFFIYPATFLMVALSLFFAPEIHTLPPTFRSVWLVLHIAFYKIAFGTIMIALSLSLSYLLKKRTGISWLSRLPRLETLDLQAYRFAGFGFSFWAIGMLAGSIWAYQSWGRFWGWDPVETWSLITWGLLGLHLHLRRFFAWRGERSACLYIACFIISVIALFFSSTGQSSIHSEYFK